MRTKVLSPVLASSESKRELACVEGESGVMSGKEETGVNSIVGLGTVYVGLVVNAGCITC